MTPTPQDLVLDYYRARNAGELDRAAELSLEPGQSLEWVRAGLGQLHAAWDWLRFDVEAVSEQGGVVEVRYAMRGRLRTDPPQAVDQRDHVARWRVRDGRLVHLGTASGQPRG